MNSAYAHFPRFFLMLCIAWYSIFATAWASDAPGTLKMEICATGMVDSVQVDTGDRSDVPSRDCCACTGCCPVAGMVPPDPFTTCLTRPYKLQRQPASAYSMRALISNLGSLPRAPPAPSNSMLTSYDMIAPDHFSTGQFMHGEGRSLPKDPSA